MSENRKDRSLFEAIPRLTKQRYGLLRTGLSAAQIKTYGEAGVKELEALRRLREDNYMKEVRIAFFWLALHISTPHLTDQ